MKAKSGHDVAAGKGKGVAGMAGSGRRGYAVSVPQVTPVEKILLDTIRVRPIRIDRTTGSVITSLLG